jgi:pyruvate dehydrogenase E2 component (dihydrolipoamide acetyltransferase)
MATGTLVDVVMPQMGVSVSEGTITRWAKSVGETVEADETIVEISTDKVDTEVPAPATGVVKELLAEEGETVDVNTRIAVIDTGGGGGDDSGGGDGPEPATSGSDPNVAAQSRTWRDPAPGS